MDFERSRRKQREMDLTPLIDIVFQLVIFFMLTTTFVVSESMELSLPSVGGTAQNSTVGAEAFQIVITRGGAVAVNHQPINMDGLQNLLVDTLGNNPEQNIMILTTDGVSVQDLVRVMDMVYLTGGRNVQVDRVVL